MVSKPSYRQRLANVRLLVPPNKQPAVQTVETSDPVRMPAGPVVSLPFGSQPQTNLPVPSVPIRNETGERIRQAPPFIVGRFQTRYRGTEKEKPVNANAERVAKKYHCAA